MQPEQAELCVHKTVWMGLCAGCGQAVEHADEYVAAPGFISLDAGFRVKRARVTELEQDTLTQLQTEQKGVLVFDLDHTLIHVTMHPADQAHAQAQARVVPLVEWLESGRRVTESEIFRFELGAVVFDLRVRPYALELLAWCSRRFHLYVYTHGTVPYASVILKALDPQGEWFGERVIARDSLEKPAGAKQLSRIFPTEHKLCLVVDDRRDVWTPDVAQENLIQVTPFLFFPDQERARISIYGALLGANAVTGSGSSSGAGAGAGCSDCKQLKRLQTVLERLLVLAFREGEGQGDVRPHLVNMKKEVLKNLRITTSGIIPVNEQDPWSHPVSVTLRELGALEPLSLEEVDILVTASPLTEKARQVEKLGGKLVKPEYLLFALSALKTPDSEKFAWANSNSGDGIAASFWDEEPENVESEDLLNDLLADLA